MTQTRKTDHSFDNFEELNKLQKQEEEIIQVRSVLDSLGILDRSEEELLEQYKALNKDASEEELLTFDLPKVPKETIGKQIERLLYESKLVGVNEFAPYYVCSIGCHIANLFNKGFDQCLFNGVEQHQKKERRFWTVQGKTEDLRLHVLPVGVPGSGKSEPMVRFIDSDIGMLKGVLPVTFGSNSLSQKGLLGGKTETGAIEETALLYTYRYGVVAFHEFDSVITTGQKEHSSTLLNDFLDAMDHGQVRIDLGGQARIEWKLSTTFWGGMQPNRFRKIMSHAGMLRRMVLIDMSPSFKRMREYKKARRDGRNILPNYTLIEEIRNRIRSFVSSFDVVKIEMTKEYSDWLYSEDYIKASEEIIADRIAIGYTLMYLWDDSRSEHPDGGSIITVRPTEEIKKLIKRSIEMKENIMEGNTMTMAKKILLENPGGVTMTEFQKKLSKVAEISYSRASEVTKLLITKGIIKTTVLQRDGGVGRPTTKLFFNHSDPE